MTQTVYVPVEASGVNTYAVNIPSGADTTSGYYLSYNAAPGAADRRPSSSCPMR